MPTEIPWTDEVWNPMRGCAPVSEGCKHCYAARQARRMDHPGGAYERLTLHAEDACGEGMGQGPHWRGHARFIPEQLEKPLRWKKPRRIFVPSMSDLFHPDITNVQIMAMFGIMAACSQHTFQCLTKRPERMRVWFATLADDSSEWSSPDPHLDCDLEAARFLVGQHTGHLPKDSFSPDWPDPAEQLKALKHYPPALCEFGLSETMERGCPWPLPNVWLGVSVENQARADERIPLLLQCPAAVRWVSLEPMLGPVDLEHLRWPGRHKVDVLRGGSGMPTLDWVVVGGETGPGARMVASTWMRHLRDQCQEAGVPIFIKQMGSAWELARKDRGTPIRRGWLPEDLRVREYP